MISGKTRLIAHIGYPTESFKAPLIYNPWFEQKGIDAVVVPMGVRADDFPGVLASLRKLTNLHGALVTMPHKVTIVGLLDESEHHGQDRRLLQRAAAPARRHAGRRHVRRRGVRARPEAQGLRDRGRLLPRRRGGRRRLGDRRVAGGRGAGVDLAVRHRRGVGRGPRGAAARALSADRGRPALERPRGVRPRRQRDAARHEGRRSAAVRRGAPLARRPSSARS